MLLELRRGGARPPQHPVDVERRGEQLCQNTGPGSGDREIGEESGVIPVRDTRHDDAVDVRHQRRERLAQLGGGGWESGADVAGLGAREDRVLLRVREVSRDPVDEGVARRGEFRRGQVTEGGLVGPIRHTVRESIARAVWAPPSCLEQVMTGAQVGDATGLVTD